MPLIKRYGNRKLYNTAARRYISLAGIAELVRQGADVRVVDHATGEDVTALILTQIIVEQEKQQGGSLPGPVLAGLIQAGGDTLAALQRALAAPLDLLRQVDEEIERRVQRLILIGELAEEDGLRLRDQLMAWSYPLHEPDWPGEQDLERALLERCVATRSEYESLARQVEALAAEVECLSGGEGRGLGIRL